MKVHYERYGARYKDSHDSLDWDDQDEEVQRFKHEQIFPNIIKGEIEDNSMGLWIEKIKGHSYEPNDDVPEIKNEEIEGGDEDPSDTEKDENDVCDVVKKNYNHNSNSTNNENVNCNKG